MTTVTVIDCEFHGGPWDGQTRGIPIEDRQVPERLVGEGQMDPGRGRYVRRYAVGTSGRRVPFYQWQ